MDYKEKFERLPKWAQLELTRLKSDCEALEKKVSQIYGESETNTYIIDGLEYNPINNNAQVQFRTGHKHLNSVSVRIDKDNDVYISTDSRIGQTMVIIPKASNVFKLKFVDVLS